MPNWNEIGQEIATGQHSAQTIFDNVRRKYLQELSELTSRNVISYYSGWLQSGPSHASALAITDHDMIGLMSACNGLDHAKGLDLFLHTPGGEIAATQAIVQYIHSMFDDVRVIVPQLAMSAGTMIACSAKSIVMGKQSSLGPIDPQLAGMAAHGVLEEFSRAHEEIKRDPSKAAVWQPIINKYPPTLIGECQKAIDLSEHIVKQWLENGMFHGHDDAKEKAEHVVEELGDHARTKLHDRHFSADECRSFGLHIERLEDDQKFQDAVLSVHHASMHTLTNTGTLKIIENQNGQPFNVSAGPIPRG